MYKYKSIRVGFLDLDLDMDASTRAIMHELANEKSWSFVGEIIYTSQRATGRIVSLECLAIEPALDFEAREYLSSDDLGERLQTEYSRIPYIREHPPCSEEIVAAFEARHSLKLPELARTFLRSVSSSLMDLEMPPKYARIAEDTFEYSIFDFEDVSFYEDVSFDEDEDDDDQDMTKYTSQVVDIFSDRNPFLTMVINGPHKGRIFNFSCESGIGCTQDQVDFFLNGMTPTVNNMYGSISIMPRVFPGLKKVYL